MATKQVRQIDRAIVVPIVALVLLGVALVVLLLVVVRGFGPWWWLAGAAATVLGLYVAAPRFSGRTVSLAAIVLVVLALIGLVRLGLRAIEDDRFGDARSRATTLLAEVATVERRLDPVAADPSPAKAAEAAISALESFAGTLPGGSPLAGPAVTLVEQLRIAATQNASGALEGAEQALQDLKAAAVNDDTGPLVDAAGAALAAVAAAQRPGFVAVAVDDAAGARAAVTAFCQSARGHVAAFDLPAVTPAGQRCLAASPSIVGPALKAAITTAALCPPSEARGSIIGAWCDGPEPIQDDEALVKAVTQVCAAQPPPDDEAVRTVCRVSTLSQRERQLLQATAELAVARARLAVATADEKAGAQATLTQREQAFAAALEERDKPAEPVSVVDAASAGGNEVASLMPGSGDVPLAVQAAGWVVLAALGLGLVRLLSHRNGKWSLGPATLKAEDGAKAEETEAFRTYLLRNLPEPGAIPGGQALAAMTDIAGTITLPGGPWLKQTLSAITAAVKPPLGYEVEYHTIATGDEPAAGSSTESVGGVAINVRIQRAGTAALIDQKIFRAKDRSTAIRSGAYWAAARIIEGSRSVPAWSTWSGATAPTLAALYREQDIGKVDLALLRAAAMQAPASGVLALTLSHEEAMAGNTLAAFRMALKATTLYPRYLNACYRLAVSASLLAAQPGPARRLPDAERLALVDLLAAYGRLRGRDSRRSRQLAVAFRQGRDLTVPLCNFALEELRACRRLVSTEHLALNSLRTDERRYWMPFLTSQQRRRDARKIGETCELVVLARLMPSWPNVVRQPVALAVDLLASAVRRLPEAEGTADLRKQGLQIARLPSSDLTPEGAAAWREEVESFGAEGEKRAAEVTTLNRAQRRALKATSARADQLAEALGRVADNHAPASLAQLFDMRGASVAPSLRSAWALDHEVRTRRAQSWQVAYNLACFWSVIAQRNAGTGVYGEALDRAIEDLELATVGRNNEQLTREWVSTDPDLEGIANEARFDVLRDTIRTKEDRSAAAK